MEYQNDAIQKAREMDGTHRSINSNKKETHFILQALIYEIQWKIPLWTMLFAFRWDNTIKRGVLTLNHPEVIVRPFEHKHTHTYIEPGKTTFGNIFWR